MANYPKPRTKETTVKDSKWRRVANPTDLPDTTKYTRWYGNTKVSLYHKKGEKNKKGENIYTYERVSPDRWYFANFYAASLKKAQERMDLYYGDLATRKDVR